MGTVAKKIMMGSGAVGDPVDDQFNRVSFLSHFEGSNNGVNNAFDDGSASNHTITAAGNVTQGSFGPFARPDGEWGVDFDGDGDYLSVPYSTDFNFGTGSFTIEAFVFPKDLSGSQGIYATNGGEGGNPKFIIYLDGATPKAHINGFGSSLFLNATATISANEWNHLAFVRNGSTWYWFVNGTQAGTGSNSTNITFSNVATVVGYGGESGNTPINSFISNIRVVNGTALYTSNFTAPTSALTAVTNTKLLTCQSNRFVDNSASPLTITPVGNPAVSAFGPFLTSEIYSAATNGASAYFDGSGDYLQAANSADWDLGTGNFTWECYAYITDITRTQWFFSVFTTNSGDNAWGLRLEANGTLNAYFSSDGGESPSVVGVAAASSGLTENAWHHIAAVKNGTGSNNIQVYVDGVSRVTGTFGAIYDTGLPLTVGRQMNTSYPQYFLGYISDARIVKGTAVYTSNFTPPTAPLTAITNTKLLLNMADGQAIDSAAQNNLTLYGNAKISTGQAKFGDTSMVFDETGDYVTLPNNSFKPFGTGNFTIECFARFATSTVGNGQGLFQLSSGYLNSAVRGPAAGANNEDGKWSIYHGTTFLGHGSLVPSQNTWYHVAYVRNLGVTKLYIDGTEILSVSDTTDYTDKYFVVGGWYSTSYLLNGYIDDFRVSMMARYTSNFSPPTEPFADEGK